jgi:hypothetical protein
MERELHRPFPPLPMTPGAARRHLVEYLTEHWSRAHIPVATLLVSELVTNPVRRPRVRTVADEAGVEREVRLESYDTFASVDLLADHMVASMLAGLSGRRYESALEPVGETVEAVASGTSQSSVSRRFITATAERLAEFRSRPLDDRRWLIVFIDRFDFAGHTMIGALGVTADGTKVPSVSWRARPRTRRSCVT